MAGLKSADNGLRVLLIMFKSACLWLVVGLCAATTLRAQSTVLYETHFERAEGYDPAFDLAGQRGWLIDGTGGNGLLADFFPGLGQQAYLGFTPPSTGAVTTVWRPINFNPAPAGNPIVHFSVKMQIEKSTQSGDDDFRWTAYITNCSPLFELSF